MRLLINGTTLLFDKFVLQKSNGKCLKRFCSHMGIAYIKLAQILAMQNINGLFTAEDRNDILHIVDDCNRVPFSYVDKILRKEFGEKYKSIIKKINHKPEGSASVSQVHAAILTTGEKVVFKVKRQDIDKTVRKDIRNIKIIIRLFGKLLGFTNYIGSNMALDMYADWIMQELDFKHEVQNILEYKRFADSVNGKLPDCTNILVPKVYKEYCTENVVCMEYIPYPTVSKLEFTSETKERVIAAGCSYIKLSFYALLNNQKVVFHGDPHTGNIYIDDEGNIGFLDFGLVFSLTPADSSKTRDLFFMTYFGEYDKLFKTLKPALHTDKDKTEEFKEEVKTYCECLKSKPITSYFMDLCVICFRYDITPDSYLFNMAKAFVCLGGIDTVYENSITAHYLLDSMVLEYLYTQTLSSMRKLSRNNMKALCSVLLGDKRKFFDTIADSVSVLSKLIEI